MKVKSITAFCLFPVCLVAGTDVAVTDSVQLTVSSNTVLTAQTARQIAFPDDVGTPIFWLDCSDTNGWTFTADGGVLKLPSKVPGSTRYLTSDKNDPNYANFSWKCFGYPNQYAVRDPVWVEPPVFTSPENGLAGRGVLDFGEQGSRRALIFDLWSPDGSCVASNKLSNIGSVFAVYDSVNGGGLFLGGGSASGYGWLRGNKRVDSSDVQSYSDAAFIKPHAFDRVYDSRMRHFGSPVDSRVVGFSGAWEVLTFCPATGTTVLDATSVGGGDMRPASIPANYYKTSGGMRIAEMIFFSETLSEEAVRKVEVYLQSKWLNNPAGWNGNAVLSALAVDVDRGDKINDGVDLEISAGEDETVSLQTVHGGQSGSTFVKTGQGRLAFGAAPNFNTPLEVRGGSISFTRRPVPSDVPGRYVFRLDAMRTDLVTKDDDNHISRVDNCGGHQFGGFDIYLTTPYSKPKFVPDALGTGKPIIDLGEVSDSGAFLKFTTDADTNADVKVPGVCSVVAVVGAQNGGGSIAASRSLRRGLPLDSFKSQLLTSDGGEYCKVYVDGIGLEPTSGYPTPGYHVIAIQSANADADGMLGFGAKLAKNGCGGLRIAEAVVYDRILTDEELKDASAYLMNKWFGRVPGDYQNPSASAGSVELQKLKMAEGTVVDVPEGGVAKVGRLDIDYPAVKTGKGTLKIQSSTGAASLLTVQEGSVVFEAALDVSGTTELAQGASVHLDASNAGSFETVQEGGTNFVMRWYSPGFGNLAYSNPGRSPWLDGSQKLNGKPTIDFGDYGTRSTGNYMVFGKALHSVRSAYILWRPHHTNASTIGSSKNSYGAANATYDFVSANGLVFRNNLFSEIYTNGVLCARNDLKVVPDQWVLVEAHSADVDTGGLTASALGADRDKDGFATTSYGGAQYAEVVLFERELSDREKIATRNYLLNKWLPSVELTELPAMSEQKESTVAAIQVSDEFAQSVEPDETLAAGRLVGDGVLEKSGAGTLAVRDLADFAGTVNVKEGTLKLTGEAPTYTGPVADGLVYHADATWGVTTETTADGVKKVVEWKSKLDDGWTAVPPVTWGDFKPRYMENALNGRPVVDLAVPVDTNMLQCLRFKKDGGYATLSGLRTVLWVFGSQYGGGYILGGGDANNGGMIGREWMRVAVNQIPKRYPTLDDPVLYGGADKAGRWGRWRVNGVVRTDTAEKPTSPWLSGAWDMLAWDTQTSTRNATADGFGFDRTIFETEWSDSNAWRMTGQQRLAEVLFYSKTLSDEELTATENYLSAKWGLCGMRSTVTNAASVVLAEGAVLDMDAMDQYLAAIGGTGAVINGTGAELTLGAISFDCDSDDCLSIVSTVAIEKGFTVHFENFPEDGVNKTFKIADVSGLENRSGSTRIAVTGIDRDCQAILRYRDGGLYVQILPKRFILLFR